MTGQNQTSASSQLSEMTSGGNKGNAQLIYILYFVGIFVGLTTLIGVVMAYLNKSEGPAWLKSHYVWLIRTFWIGLLFSVIGAILSVVLIGFLLLAATLIWLIIRLVQGLNYLGKNQPVPNTSSWFFAG